MSSATRVIPAGLREVTSHAELPGGSSPIRDQSRPPSRGCSRNDLGRAVRCSASSRSTPAPIIPTPPSIPSRFRFERWRSDGQSPRSGDRSPQDLGGKGAAVSRDRRIRAQRPPARHLLPPGGAAGLAPPRRSAPPSSRAATTSTPRSRAVASPVRPMLCVSGSPGRSSSSIPISVLRSSARGC